MTLVHSKVSITNLDAVRERLTASPVKAQIETPGKEPVANEIIRIELTRECAEWLIADIDKRRKRIGQCVSDANTRQRKREKREHELYFVAAASDAINNALNNTENQRKMTREEEIKVLALKYLDHFTPDICGICDEDVFDAYISGAKWADENPDLESIWHDADEEPKGEYQIMCQDEFESAWITDYRETIENYKNGWEECAYCECIARWAYVSDLLPKGGEK